MVVGYFGATDQGESGNVASPEGTLDWPSDGGSGNGDGAGFNQTLFYQRLLAIPVWWVSL